MADERAKLLAGFIGPLRVEPGPKVKLAKDFDPGYKASFLKKKDAAAVLQAGVGVQAKRMKKIREKLTEAER
jgi:UDP-N-acetylenolpyruvoylglucosamine reductase